MSVISDEEKDEVRAASDLVAIVQETVELKPRGHEFWGCCPFHGEKTPSFHIIPATQVWHCFGCGEGGDVFTYIMKRENLSFPSQSVIWPIVRVSSCTTPEIVASAVPSVPASTVSAPSPAQFYHTMLMRGKDGRPREYFPSRGMGGDVCRRYCLGFAPGRNALVSHLSQAGFTPQEMIDANVAVSRGRRQLADRFYDRVMFPIFDEQGHNIAFGGRIMGDGQPKYLNTAETSVFHKSETSMALTGPRSLSSRRIRPSWWRAIPIVSPVGRRGLKTLSPRWAPRSRSITSRRSPALLSASCICLTAMPRAKRPLAARFVSRAGFDGSALRRTADGNDPMEFITAHGGRELQARIDAAEPLMDFVYRSLQESSDISTPGGRAKALEDALTLIYPLRDSYMIDTYFIQIADLLVWIWGRCVRARAVCFAMSPSARMRNDVVSRTIGQRAQAERSGSAGGRTSGSQGASRGAWASGATPPVSAPVEEEPYDYVPLDAYGAAPVEVVDDLPPIDVPDGMGAVPVTDGSGTPAAAAPMVLTDLERKSLAGERELLTMLTSYPDLFRTYADRICSIEWVDPRRRSIAWAVLATPRESILQPAWMRRARCVPRRQRL